MPKDGRSSTRPSDGSGSCTGCATSTTIGSTPAPRPPSPMGSPSRTGISGRSRSRTPTAAGAATTAASLPDTSKTTSRRSRRMSTRLLCPEPSSTVPATCRCATRWRLRTPHWPRAGLPGSSSSTMSTPRRKNASGLSELDSWRGSPTAAPEAAESRLPEPPCTSSALPCPISRQRSATRSRGVRTSSISSGSSRAAASSTASSMGPRSTRIR